jgi:hypothetical protein
MDVIAAPATINLVVSARTTNRDAKRRFKRMNGLVGHVETAG